jgi:hypothetical protein
MPQKLPRSSQTHLCAACYKTGRHVPATWVTTRGFCVCDKHLDDVEARGMP